MTQVLKDMVAAMIVAAMILIVLGVLLSAGIGVAVVFSWLW